METLAPIPFALDEKTLMEQVHVEPDSDDAREFVALLEQARAIANPINYGWSLRHFLSRMAQIGGPTSGGPT